MNRILLLLGLCAGSALAVEAQRGLGLEVVSLQGAHYAEPHALAATLRGTLTRHGAWTVITTPQHRLKLAHGGVAMLDGTRVALPTTVYQGRRVWNVTAVAAAFARPITPATVIVVPTWTTNTAAGPAHAPSRSASSATPAGTAAPGPATTPTPAAPTPAAPTPAAPTPAAGGGIPEDDRR